MLDEFFSGNKLYGDDFDLNQIKEWFEHENEAYANLSNSKPVDSVNDISYGYHVLNKMHGFDHLKLKNNLTCLGVGAAFGAELLPISAYLKEIHILEPSEKLNAKYLEEIPLHYSKPEISGKLKYSDNSFDIITCFGTLHHIPNVSFVVSELSRVLKKDGILLIREPIISMGNWNFQRKGLTKFERGIPLKIFREIILRNNLIVQKETFCFTMTFFFQKIFRKKLYDIKMYMILDKLLSKLFLFNYHYHATNKFQRISPTNVFYILKKK